LVEIQSRTDYLLDEGYPATALSKPEQKILKQVAAGAAIEEAKSVLVRAEKLVTHLSWETLKHWPRWPRPQQG
jgi:hypothetical protein